MSEPTPNDRDYWHSGGWAVITWILVGFTLAASVAEVSRGEWPLMSWAFVLALVMWRVEVVRHKATLRQLGGVR